MPSGFPINQGEKGRPNDSTIAFRPKSPRPSLCLARLHAGLGVNQEIRVVRAEAPPYGKIAIRKTCEWGVKDAKDAYLQKLMQPISVPEAPFPTRPCWGIEVDREKLRGTEARH